jgi:hypothetical protein
MDIPVFLGCPVYLHSFYQQFYWNKPVQMMDMQWL